MAGDLLYDGDGALAHQRHGDWMGAHALARDAAGGVGGAEADAARMIQRPRRRAVCRVCGEELLGGRHNKGWRHSKRGKHRDHRAIVGYVWVLPRRR